MAATVVRSHRRVRAFGVQKVDRIL